MTESHTWIDARERAMFRLLEGVRFLNDTGETPSKGRVCRWVRGSLPQRTQANWYRMLDRLLERGLIRNNAPETGGTRFELQITKLGRMAVEAGPGVPIRTEEP